MYPYKDVGVYLYEKGKKNFVFYESDSKGVQTLFIYISSSSEKRTFLLIVT